MIVAAARPESPAAGMDHRAKSVQPRSFSIGRKADIGLAGLDLCVHRGVPGVDVQLKVLLERGRAGRVREVRLHLGEMAGVRPVGGEGRDV